eukprot:1716225-Amphidinium_carterae.1
MLATSASLCTVSSILAPVGDNLWMPTPRAVLRPIHKPLPAGAPFSWATLVRDRVSGSVAADRSCSSSACWSWNSMSNLGSVAMKKGLPTRTWAGMPSLLRCNVMPGERMHVRVSGRRWQTAQS